MTERRTLSASNTFSVVLLTSSFAALVLHMLKRRSQMMETRRKASCAYRMIDGSDGPSRSSLIISAVRRASTCMPYRMKAETKPLDSQVGGLSSHKKRVLSVPPFVLKPLHTDHRGYREVAFYETLVFADVLLANDVNATNDERWIRRSSFLDVLNTVAPAGVIQSYNAIMDKFKDDGNQRSWRYLRNELELLRPLVHFTPGYFGVIDQGPTERLCSDEICNGHYLVLNDVTEPFVKPCVIDLKMGRQSYEPTATQEKQNREYAKYPQQSVFGFRIVGMRVYDPHHTESDSSGYRVYGKEFGRSLDSREKVVGALGAFFSTEGPHRESDGVAANSEMNKRTSNVVSILRTQAILNLLKELKSIRGWFESNRSLCFYSSSILMVYEGDTRVATDSDAATLKMIDFGHVRRESGGDQGYFHGLQTLTGILTLLLNDEQHIGSLLSGNEGA